MKNTFSAVFKLKQIFLGFSFFIYSISSQAAVITFEEFGLVNNIGGNGEVTGNEWAGSGVEFSTNGIALNLGGTVGSTPNSLGADLSAADDFSGNLSIQFLNGVSYTDVFFTIFNTPFEASAFSSDNNLLTTLSSGGDFTQLFDFTGFAVNRIEITGTFYAIDDLNFSTASVSAVPVPAAVWLFGSGLFGLIGMGKRKSKTNAH